MQRTGKRIVITTWGSFGDLHPYMAIALELQNRGHRPVIATIPFYKDKIERAGISFHAVRPDLPFDRAPDLIKRAVDVRDGARYIWKELIAPHLRETYDDTLAAVTADGGADLLISHMVTTAAPLVAEKTGVQWVSTVLFPLIFLSAYDPPTLAPLPSLRTIAALHPIVSRTLFALAKMSTRSWMAPVKELRKELGLPPGKNPIFEGQHSPELVLALFSKVLAQVQPDFPANTRITGFPFYDEQQNRPSGSELARFLDSGEPPILFTLGSSAVWVAEDFYRTSIEAVRQMKKRALLLVGDHRNLPSEELPTGVAAFDYASYHTVMPRVSCIVHQGGIGTTGQALRSGKPMLIMPFGHDTADNARRCTELGVGRTLSRNKYKVKRVVAELSELLENAAYRNSANEIGRQVRGEDGTRRACDALEEFL